MIDQKKFEIPQDLEVDKDKIIHFARDQLIKFQPKKNYKELSEISIVFLESIPDRDIPVSKTRRHSPNKMDD